MVLVDDETALTRALAERFVVAASAGQARHKRFDVALAGGSTPKGAYELLATPAWRDRVDWTRVRFFFGDERCVPPDDEASNYRMARLAFGDVMTSAGAVFRMRGEDEPAMAARAYADVLRSELGDAPVFDLIMLGLGPDGHTASLFPDADPYLDDALLVRAPFVPKFGTHRLTLTPKVLNGAREIVVATAGDAKAAALRAVLEGPAEPERYPAQVLAPRDGSLTWLVDRQAGALLATAGSAQPNLR